MAGTVDASYGDLLVTSVVVLAVVCVAAFVIVRVVGRWMTTGRARGSHLMEVVARLPLEPRRSLYVVAVAGKTLLIGTSEMGLNVLSELDGAEVQARDDVRPSFGELVRSAWLRRRADRGDPRGAGTTPGMSAAGQEVSPYGPAASVYGPGAAPERVGSEAVSAASEHVPS